MAIKKITLTEDHLKLISNIQFTKFDIDTNSASERFGWGVDQWNLFGGTYVLEEIAFIIGRDHEYIKGSEESPSGKAYPIDLEEYMWDLYDYIYDNMTFIESLIHQFICKGGLKVGTYKCIDYKLDWVFIEK